ncbi:MAG: MBL fold metallo-hydrolase [Candidatus Paracaedibacteraceae bacterium]|nr:MBL fold metallo-hydrolase [Candidatus Paracaedibacteraceae bacterium]
MKITILGSGSSGGVPLATGDWGDCDRTNPKNHRKRASIHIEIDGVNIVIDTGTDFRQQILDYPVSKLDAVLYTHSHADHIFGLDELRHFYFKQKQPIPIYADPKTLEALQHIFAYAFKAPEGGPYRTFIDPHTFSNHSFKVCGIDILPIKLDHTVMTSWGFRIGNFAYCTDFKRIEPIEMQKLEGLEIFIVDCLMFDEHKTHVKFDETMQIIESLHPKRSILTHMNQLMDYEVALSRCPAGVEPGYDGMIISPHS